MLGLLLLQYMLTILTISLQEMLKELMDFASQGCIDISDVREQANQLKQLQDSHGDSETIKEKRAQVLDLIQKLRNQTEDLEKFAYDQGHGGMPMSELKQRQKMVFDKLQEKIKLKVELENDPELLKLSLDEGLEQVSHHFFKLKRIFFEILKNFYEFAVILLY